MGQAKRRKELDPNFGKTPRESKSNPRFKVTKVERECSIYDGEKPCLVAEVVDLHEGRAATAEFIISHQEKKLYAHAVISKHDLTARWVGEHINSISPLVCKDFIKDLDYLICTE